VDTQYNSGIVRLTNTVANGQSGTLGMTSPVARPGLRVELELDLDWVYRPRTPQSSGNICIGDGFALAFSAAARTASGDNGGSLSVGGTDTLFYVGVDSYHNNDQGEPGSNFLGIGKTAPYAQSSEGIEWLTFSGPNRYSVSGDNLLVSVTLTETGVTATLSQSGTTTEIQQPMDWTLYPDEMYLSLNAATGGCSLTHDVRWLTIGGE
jgi:hypothetical protein